MQLKITFTQTRNIQAYMFLNVVTGYIYLTVLFMTLAFCYTFKMQY